MLAGEVGPEGAQKRGTRSVWWFFWPLNASVVCLDRGEENQLSKFHFLDLGFGGDGIFVDFSVLNRLYSATV